MPKYIKLARPKEASPVHRQRGSLPHAQEICLTDTSSRGSSQKSLRSNNNHINTSRIQSLAAWKHAQCFQNEEENFQLGRHPKSKRLPEGGGGLCGGAGRAGGATGRGGGGLLGSKVWEESFWAAGWVSTGEPKNRVGKIRANQGTVEGMHICNDNAPNLSFKKSVH